MWAYEYLLIRYLTHTVPYAMLIRLRLVFPLTSSLSRWEFFCAVVVVPPFQFSRSLICLFVLILPSIYWWCYSSRCCGWYVTPVNIQHIICILPQSQSIRPCYSICVCECVFEHMFTDDVHFDAQHKLQAYTHRVRVPGKRVFFLSRSLVLMNNLQCVRKRTRIPRTDKFAFI